MSILCPIMVFNEDGEYIPMYAGSYIVKPSDIEPIIQGLIRYKNSHTDSEIEEFNKEKEYQMYHCHTNKKEKSNKRNEGYVYILSCSNKYKIGFSKNVQNRIKQLDTRPFELKLLFTVYSNKAYTIEQLLHEKLEKYKDVGEWYSNINEQMIKETIIDIGEELQCEIQF